MSEFLRNISMAEAAQRVSQKKQEVRQQGRAESKSFGDVLREVRFSKHAADRISARDINLSDSDLERLGRGVGLAKEKGIRQTLIMMDNKVFIASVTNNTIITAATDENLKENVFTNIDGAVIV